MSGKETGRRDGRDVIASRLLAAELQLRAMQAQLHADLELTRFDEPVPELDELVDGLIGLLRSVAEQLGVTPDKRSAQTAVDRRAVRGLG